MLGSGTQVVVVAESEEEEEDDDDEEEEEEEGRWYRAGLRSAQIEGGMPVSAQPRVSGTGRSSDIPGEKTPFGGSVTPKTSARVW